MEIVLSILLNVLILAFALLVLSRTWIFIGRMTINEIRNIRARLYIKILSILKRQTELILSIGPCIYFKAIGRILCIIIKARLCREQIHKTILLVGDGYFHPAPLLRTARSMGITLHAIVSDQMSYQQFPYVYHLTDLSQRAIKSEDSIIKMIESSGFRYDGILTVDEYYAPLAAKLASYFQVPGHPVKAANLVCNKHTVRQHQKKLGLHPPRFALISSERDINKAIRHTGFPCVLKPCYGVHQQHVYLNDSAEQVFQHYSEAQEKMEKKNGKWNLLSRFGREMLLEECLAGDYFTLDLLFLDGEVLLATTTLKRIISENKVSLFFGDTLTQEQKKKALNVVLPVIHSLGLKTGALHIEMIMKDDQFQIIEINNRLIGIEFVLYGLDNLFRPDILDWIRGIFLVSLGQRPKVISIIKPVLNVKIDASGSNDFADPLLENDSHARCFVS